MHVAILNNYTHYSNYKSDSEVFLKNRATENKDIIMNNDFSDCQDIIYAKMDDVCTCLISFTEGRKRQVARLAKLDKNTRLMKKQFTEFIPKNRLDTLVKKLTDQKILIVEPFIGVKNTVSFQFQERKETFITRNGNYLQKYHPSLPSADSLANFCMRSVRGNAFRSVLNNFQPHSISIPEGENIEKFYALNFPYLFNRIMRLRDIPVLAIEKDNGLVGRNLLLSQCQQGVCTPSVKQSRSVNTPYLNATAVLTHRAKVLTENHTTVYLIHPDSITINDQLLSDKESKIACYKAMTEYFISGKNPIEKLRFFEQEIDTLIDMAPMIIYHHEASSIITELYDHIKNVNIKDKTAAFDPAKTPSEPEVLTNKNNELDSESPAKRLRQSHEIEACHPVTLAKFFFEEIIDPIKKLQYCADYFQFIRSDNNNNIPFAKDSIINALRLKTKNALDCIEKAMDQVRSNINGVETLVDLPIMFLAANFPGTNKYFAYKDNDQNTVNLYRAVGEKISEWLGEYNQLIELLPEYADSMDNALSTTEPHS